MIEKYPYFMAPCIEQYMSLDPKSKKAEMLRLRISVNIPDNHALSLIFNENVQETGRDVFNKKKEKDSTIKTIDSFLDRFGGRTQSIPGSYVIQEPQQETENDSENLAFLIRNKEYQKVLKIIELRNLNNPEKNIYFADQIRFLKKLIKIENHKNNL